MLHSHTPHHYSTFDEDYVAHVETAQSQYLKSVYEVRTLFHNNVDGTQQMDDVFGVPTIPAIHEVDAAQPEQQRVSTKRLTCPVLPCNARTYKLRRHLKERHPELQEEVIRYAMTMSLDKEKNRSTTDVVSPPKPVNKRRFPTELVNRKNNYKECSLCGTLCKNMTNRIGKTHKILKIDSSYRGLVGECPVIPQCYLKFAILSQLN